MQATGGGLVVEPGNVNALADALVTIGDLPVAPDTFGLRAAWDYGVEGSLARYRPA